MTSRSHTLPRLVVLDRDGVINQDSSDYVKSVDEWIPIAGSIEAIVRLKEAGVKVAIATNQSGLARGYFSEVVLDAMHRKMANLIASHLPPSVFPIDYIAYCPHAPDEGCQCRKPKTGLLEAISKRLKIDLAGQVMVGDSLKDIQAARAMDMQAYLVETGNGKQTMRSNKLPESVLTLPDLAAVVDRLLR